MVKSAKFYFFDVGVFQSLRPRGPLDATSEIMGSALETLVLQEMMAQNQYRDFHYEIFYWRTQTGQYEVDFVLYGERGIKAIEVKLADRIRPNDCKGLLEFAKDYPQAKLFLLYTGRRRYVQNDIEILPVEQFLKEIPSFLK